MIESLMELMFRMIGYVLGQVWLLPTWVWWALAIVLALVAVLKPSLPAALAAGLVVVLRLVFAWLERQSVGR